MQKTIVGLGEVLWDVFPDGPRFGGAPANFACSAAEIGGHAFHVAMISAVGSDEPGRLALRELSQREVDISCMQSIERPTGQVLVSLDSAGQAEYKFLDHVAWDHLTWSDQLELLASKTDAVCFGTLGQRHEQSQRTIRKFVAATSPECLRILDINLRPPYWTPALILDTLPLANVLKLNSDELSVVADLLSIRGNEREQLVSIQETCALRLLVLTRGASGSILLDDTGEVSELPGQAITIADTVGAGDSFTAAIAAGLLTGKSLKVIHRFADEVAAFVCSQPGATPKFPERCQLRSLVERT